MFVFSNYDTNSSVEIETTVQEKVAKLSDQRKDWGEIAACYARLSIRARTDEEVYRFKENTCSGGLAAFE